MDVDLGTAAIVHDEAKEEELRNPILNAWFSDGLETPGLALIRSARTAPNTETTRYVAAVQRVGHTPCRPAVGNVRSGWQAGG